MDDSGGNPRYGVSRRILLKAAVSAPLAAALPIARAQGEHRPVLVAQRLAWAGIKLELGKVALFVDASTPAPERGAPGPALETSATQRFALVSHHHADHYDAVFLKPALGELGFVVATADVARFFVNRTVNVHTVNLYEPVFLSRMGGEFVAFCVPAGDGLGSPQVSWVIDGGGRRIIHCGDTGWHGGWWDIARAYGPFDLAFLPINGARQPVGRFHSVTQPMSMTPEQAASAAAILKPRTTVPIHYGDRGDPLYIEERHALARFRQAAQALRVPVRIVEPGEAFEP